MQFMVIQLNVFVVFFGKTPCFLTLFGHFWSLDSRNLTLDTHIFMRNLIFFKRKLNIRSFEPGLGRLNLRILEI